MLDDNTAAVVNPAILVDGDLNLGGNINLLIELPCPACGSMHANGDLVLTAPPPRSR